jgi:hypothetical protein
MPTHPLLPPRPGRFWLWAGRLSSFLQHNFVLLVLTTAVTVVAVPRVTDRVNRGAVIQQQRIQAGLQVLQDGNEVEQRLANLHVRLGSFTKDVWLQNPPQAEFRLQQARLRDQMTADYLEFNRSAWGWIYATSSRLRVLGITDPVEKQWLDDVGGLYAACLTASTLALDEVWGPLTRLTPATGSVSPALRAGVRERLNDYSRKRQSLVESIAELFINGKMSRVAASCDAPVSQTPMAPGAEKLPAPSSRPESRPTPRVR